MATTKKVNCTRDYRLFERSPDNRAVDLKKHKRLRASMKKYGWIPSFPMTCIRNGSARLVVKDGQHRLALAEELGIPVWWMETDIDFCVSEINTTSVGWKLRDHAEKHRDNGLEEYEKGLKFADTYGLSVGVAFALLAGTTSFGNVQPEFLDGTFKTKDVEWAEAVGALYSALCGLSKSVKNMRLMEACMAVCRVKGFDPNRLYSGAERCREKLVSYSTREAYLDLLETIYNFGRSRLVALKMPAIEAMRKRNAIAAARHAKQAK